MLASSTAVAAGPTAALPFRRPAAVASLTCPSGTCAPLLPANRGRLLRHDFHFAVSIRDDGKHSHHKSVFQRANCCTFSWRLPRVISGEAEGRPSTDDIILDEETLQRDLDKAIEEEDYARAVELRDRLSVLHEDSKAAVLSANTRFYHAFRNGDLAAMHSVWSKGEHVYVIHPGAGRISGYDLVMGSWEIVCNADYEFPLQIDLKNVEVHVRGDIGYVTCMEFFKTKGSSWGKQLATNVFERIDGQWFVCIHHASHIDG